MTGARIGKDSTASTSERCQAARTPSRITQFEATGNEDIHMRSGVRCKHSPLMDAPKHTFRDKT